MTTQFQIGRTYATRSIGDFDCVFSFTILSRTAKTPIPPFALAVAGRDL